MLDYKDNYILNLLISTSYTLNVSDIQNLLGISQRSVYYSLSKINDFLVDNNLPKLVNKKQIGIVISPELKEKLRKIKENKMLDLYLHTHEERVVLEILILLCIRDNINIQYFEEAFNVSRNTVLSDIKEIRKSLSVYNLVLDYDSNRGYIITGLEYQKRSVVLNLISKHQYLLKFSPVKFYSQNTYNDTKNRMNQFENELDITYVSTTLDVLSILISIIKQNQLPFVPITDDVIAQIELTKEFNATKNIMSGFIIEREYYYLTLHLLGLRIHTESDFESHDDEYIKEIVEFLIQEFSKMTLIILDDNHYLFKQLYTHMKQAMFRLKYGIIYQNELKNQILETYPQLSNITSAICHKLEKKIGYPIGEDDITFIAMHFGGALKRENRNLEETKVLLVCLNGIATSKLLRKELEYMFGNLQVIDAVSLDEVKLYSDDVDYIISTIPIPKSMQKDKVIQVNPVLTEHDKENLAIFIKLDRDDNNYELSNQIVSDIDQYINKNKIQEVQKIILKRLNKNKFRFNRVKERIQKPMLKQLITEEMIIFKDKVSTWQDAIRESAKPLLKNKYIENRYVEKVISNVLDMGPYIGIAPDIAISHARPEDGVNEIGMTILLLKEPVYLNNQENKPVRIMITLAAPDNERHLLALQQLSMLLTEDLNSLLSFTSIDEVLNIIEKYSS